MKAIYGRDELIKVKTPSPHYLDQFLRSRCAPDLLSLGDLWGPRPAKEISESFSALHALRKYWGGFDDPDRAAIVIGDGQYPRTGALLAHMTQWDVTSIDPILRNDGDEVWRERVARLKGFRARWEDAERDCLKRIWDDGFRKLAIVMVHSHGRFAQARLDHYVDNLGFSGMIVSLPCCVDTPTLDREPDHQYEDWAVLSPRRTVRVWSF